MIGKHVQKILELYKGPFVYNMGYIYDANGQMLADNAGENIPGIVQVRGWGYLTGGAASWKDGAEEIQDELGEMIAEALTQYWKSMEGM